MTYHEAIVYAWHRHIRDDIAVCIVNAKSGVFTYRHARATPGVYRDTIPNEPDQDEHPAPVSMQEINEALAIVAGSTA